VADDGAGQPAALTLELAGVHYGPLRGFDLRVADGELLGIVAHDAGVADTIADLAVRRADPARGTVLVGGEDARALSLDALRAHVVTVDGHHPWLLDATLRDNLALGAADRDEHTLETALLGAAGEDLLTRAGGLDEPVGERGLSLSGGQRQRLTVARAFAADPPVLVLDEPTSALDVATEMRLVERLGDVRQGRTTIVVTVSAPVLAACDRVIVVESGRVARAGRHEDLMRDSRYRNLVAPDSTADGDPA
jgi:putative ABC transport system ATP-binding protein